MMLWGLHRRVLFLLCGVLPPVTFSPVIIESKHINLRTRIKRLVRRTICFSKTERMPDLVIGLFINRYELEVTI
jgi:hypothetical protein